MPMSPQATARRNRIASSDLGRKSDLGASWNYAGLAGLFACNLKQPASNANIDIGCRLAIHARSRFFMECWTARDLGFALHSGRKNRRNTNRAGAASTPCGRTWPRPPFSGCKPDLGAQWNDAGLTGLFACNLKNTASNADISIGCRLATRARSRFFMENRTARDLGFAFRSGQKNRRNTSRTGAASNPCGERGPGPIFGMQA